MPNFYSNILNNYCMSKKRGTLVYGITSQIVYIILVFLQCQFCLNVNPAFPQKTPKSYEARLVLFEIPVERLSLPWSFSDAMSYR